ncbi:MAG: phosphoglucosamine mutase [Euryarchaeota archaeon]|nr:phosphoglucosamine mutase [Euryarchaeota archaeon]
MKRLFGPNGICGIVNQDMNGEFALGVGTAWGTYLKTKKTRPVVAIGTDARVSNNMLKSAVSSGILSTGCDVVDLGVVPTPTVRYTVKEKKFDSGVVITASQYPAQFNGIKGIDADGIEFSKAIEEAIEYVFYSKLFLCVDWTDVGLFSSYADAVDTYQKGILSNVDVQRIRKQKFHVVLDCGNGVGSLVVPTLLEKLGCTVTKLSSEPGGLFIGENSELLPETLGLLMKTVHDETASFGMALSSTADRAIFVDETGSIIFGDKIFALFGKYIVKKNKGALCVASVTTSSCFEDVITECGGQVLYTRVGSSFVARMMKEKKAVFGGEENGGFIFPVFQYCPDPAMALAMMLEIVAIEKKSLSGLVAEIPHYEVSKTKIDCPNEKKEIVMKALFDQMDDSGDVIKIDQIDGIKLFIRDGWVLMRPSGTEPFFWVYAESKTKTQAEQLVSQYKKLMNQIICEVTLL